MNWNWYLQVKTAMKKSQLKKKKHYFEALILISIKTLDILV